MKRLIAALVVALLLAPALFAAAQREAAQAVDAAGPVRILLSKGGSARVLAKGLNDYTTVSGKAVEIIEYPYAEVREKQLLDLSAKTGEIDAVAVDGPIWLAELQSFLEPLDALVAKDKLDTSIYVPSMLEMFKMKGALYALPARIGGWVLIYRTDLFQQAGLQPPVTMQDFLKTAQVLTRGDVYGFAAAFKQTNYVVAQWVPFLYSFGGNILDADMKKAVFNSPQGVAATKFLVDLFRVHKVVPPSAIDYEQNNIVTAMQQGIAAMAITYSPYYLVMNDPKTSKFPGKFAVAPVLPYDAASGLKGGITEISGWGFAVSKYSKRKAATWGLIKHMGSTPVQKKLAVEDQNSPSVAGVYSDPDYLKVFPEAKGVLSSLVTAKTRPGVRQWTKIEDLLAKELSAAVTGVKTVEQALKDAESQTNQILAQ